LRGGRRDAWWRFVYRARTRLRHYHARRRRLRRHGRWRNRTRRNCCWSRHGRRNWRSGHGWHDCHGRWCGHTRRCGHRRGDRRRSNHGFLDGRRGGRTYGRRWRNRRRSGRRCWLRDRFDSRLGDDGRRHYWPCRMRHRFFLLRDGPENISRPGDVRQIDLGLDFFFAARRARESGRWGMPFGRAADVGAHLFRFMLLQRTGMRLLLSHSDERQHVENGLAFDFQFSGEIVDSNLAHPAFLLPRVVL